MCEKIFFGEFSQINGIESSPNIGSIKLRTNLKHKVYVTNVALLIRYITSRAVIDIDDIDVSMQMSCIDIENDISIHIDIVK